MRGSTRRAGSGIRRSSCSNPGIELAMLCAFVVGGYDHMRSVSLAMREFFHHENYEEWQP